VFDQLRHQIDALDRMVLCRRGEPCGDAAGQGLDPSGGIVQRTGDSKIRQDEAPRYCNCVQFTGLIVFGVLRVSGRSPELTATARSDLAGENLDSVVRRTSSILSFVLGSVFAPRMNLWLPAIFSPAHVAVTCGFSSVQGGPGGNFRRFRTGLRLT